MKLLIKGHLQTMCKTSIKGGGNGNQTTHSRMIHQAKMLKYRCESYSFYKEQQLLYNAKLYAERGAMACNSTHPKHSPLHTGNY